jgi:hypothetical protein
MKVYTYDISSYNAKEGKFVSPETRLYFPGKAVMGIKESSKMDFFADDPDSIEAAEQLIKGNDDKNRYIFNLVENIREIILPDEEAEMMMAAGKALNDSEEKFQRSAKRLIDLIK